ncbi:glycine betaine ABC transporter substrate-binding protein [Parafrankia sp. FMc2]|uniref:glycine betaine ABC transporter substrate-binding protein n=1 Tax=Parafrankia sp. FMc2 TaxID=3233196 RepID=UPI0034D6A59D
MRLPTGRARLAASAAAVLCVIAVGVLVGVSLTGGGGADDGAAGPRITVGATSALDSSLVADLYARELGGHGYQTTVRSFPTRDQLMWALEQGTVDVAPDHLDELRSGLAGQTGSGVQTAPALTAQVVTVKGLMPALTQRRLIAYPAAPGGRAPVFAVTAATAEEHHLGTLSDLAAPGVGPALAFGAPASCSAWSACLPVLRDTYGVSFGHSEVLDNGGPGTIRALLDGKVQVALVYRSDPAVAANRLVVLEDDRHALPANNLLPVVRLDVANLQLQGVLSRVTQALTTEGLITLQQTVAAAPEDRARAVEDFLDQHVQAG